MKVENKGKGCSPLGMFASIFERLEEKNEARVLKRMEQRREKDWPVGPDGKKYDPDVGHPWSHGP